jgi:hypothetical protein
VVGHERREVVLRESLLAGGHVGADGAFIRSVAALIAG